MKQLPIAVLNVCAYVRVSLYRLHVPSAFGGRAGFDVDASNIFLQDVLASVTLVGGGTAHRGAKAEAGCEARLPLCSVAITALLWVGSDPELVEQKP